jgi:hypothetical protein
MNYELLPVVVAEKIQRFAESVSTTLQSRSLDQSALINISDDTQRFITQLESNLESVRRSRAAMRDGGEASIESLEKQIADLKKSMIDSRISFNKKVEATSALPQLFTRIEKFMRETPPEMITPAPAPKLPKVSAHILIQQQRDLIETLRIERASVARAPRPSSEVIEIITAEITAAAERVKPEFQNAFRPDSKFAWPRVKLDSLAYSAAAVTHTYSVDNFSILAWLQRRQMIAASKAEIEKLAQDDQAIASADRITRLANIDARILDAERMEEAAIMQLESDGMQFPRRADASIEAVLQIELVPIDSAP